MSVILELTAGALSSVVFEVLNKTTRDLIKEKNNPISSDIVVSEEKDIYQTDRDVKQLSTHEEKEVIEKTSLNIEQVRAELIRQAKLSFNCAIFTIVFGVVLIAIGAFFLLSENISISVFTTISGAISEILSLILIKFSNTCNDKIEKIKEDLNKLENAKVGLEIIENISNKEEKDRALGVLINSICNNISDVA